MTPMLEQLALENLMRRDWPWGFITFLLVSNLMYQHATATISHLASGSHNDRIALALAALVARMPDRAATIHYEEAKAISAAREAVTVEVGEDAALLHVHIVKLP